MFRNQIDPQETNSPVYSDALDVLLSQAVSNAQADKASVFSPDKWPDDITADNAEDSLLQGIDALEQDVRKALKYLDSPATLRLHPDSPDEVAAALTVLDHVVFLQLFVENISADSLAGSFRRRLELLYLTLTADDGEHPVFSMHRLIPLNSWRQHTGKSLSERIRHHFPWYDNWTHVPEYIPELLARHWQEIVKDDHLSLLEIPEKQARALLDAIRQDPLYYDSLQKQASLFHEIFRKMVNSLHFGLAALSNLFTTPGTLPATVTDKGFQAVACAVLDAPLDSWPEKMERLLLAAFYGPDLSEQYRMQLFKEIGLWLQEAPRVSSELAATLLKWSADPTTGLELMKCAMNTWKASLEQAAQYIKEPVPYMENGFVEAVERLLDAEPQSVMDKASNMVEELYRLLPTFPSLRETIGSVRECVLANCCQSTQGMGMAACADSMRAECLLLRKRGESIIDKSYPETREVKIETADNISRISWKIANLDVPNPDRLELSCRCLHDDRSIQPRIAGMSEQGFFAFFDKLAEQDEDISLRIVIIMEE